MTFRSIRFDTTRADAWSDALLDHGALSVDVADAFAGTTREQPQFGEPGETIAPWAVSRLVALFEARHDVAAALDAASADVGEPVPDFTVQAVDDQDWVRATQQQFGPIAIGDRLHIVPTWCELPAGASGVVLRLDPGLAFGTGSHPTTRMCLEWLVAQPLRAASVLDYGCGSGILAIAAAKHGAAPVVGTDIDEQALQASRDNARANAVDVEFVAVDALRAVQFDVVVANILANPLIALAPLIAACVRRGGRLALSGILESQSDAVVIAYSRWFTLAASRRADGWALMTGERSATS
jgi:ribosomal protein L11 methyltransferase